MSSGGLFLEGVYYMPLSLDEKYEIIYSHEENFAYALAKRVVKKPEVSVWMILIPILFIHHAHKINQYKTGVKQFAGGILSSKKKALDKSYKEVSTGEELNYGTDDYFPDVELKTLHERALGQKQAKVIRIMESHYKALFNTEGESMTELLRKAYGGTGDYRHYLNRMYEAEKELNRYLVENVHTNGDSIAVVRQIEKSCQELREEELKAFF